MIEFLEIRDTTRKLIGVIDTASSIIWQTEYYGAGRLEIYCAFNEQTKALLQRGYYVTRRGEKQAGIIESVRYTDNAETGLMIIASGRMLKSILDRRVVYNYDIAWHRITPVRISGYLAPQIQKVVREHAGTDASPYRKMGVVIGSDGGITKRITSDTEQGEESSRQSSYKNLLTWTDAVLQEYECGALMRIDQDSLDMIYDLYEGTDRSVGNTAGNVPLIFSQDFENLLTVDYNIDETFYKNFAVIGGEGQGLERFFTLYRPDNSTGLARREVFVDASSINRKYMDGDEEKTYTTVQYQTMLEGQAQTELKELITTEVFDGEINVTHSAYKYGTDFGLGDLVTVQDNRLELYRTVRILRATEVQDAEGYLLTFEYAVKNEEV